MANPKEIDESRALDLAGASVQSSSTISASYNSGTKQLSLGIVAGSITPSHFNLQGAATNGKFLRWNNVLGKPDWAAYTDATPAPYSIGANATQGFLAGGYLITSAIDKFSLAANTTATSHGTLSAALCWPTGCSSSTQGFTVKGSYTQNSGVTADVNKFNFASNTTSTLHGALSTTRALQGSSQSTTTGYSMGGANACNSTNTNPNSNIDKFDFATFTSGQTHGNLLNTRRIAQASASSSTQGFNIGGYLSSGSGTTTTIDKFDFSSNTTGTGHGTVSNGNSAMGGCSSDTQGFTTRGAVTKFDFSSNTTGTSHGSLNWNTDGSSGVSGPTNGYSVGYDIGTQIDKFSFTSNTTATAFGALDSGRCYGAGCQG